MDSSGSDDSILGAHPCRHSPKRRRPSRGARFQTDVMTPPPDVGSSLDDDDETWVKSPSPDGRRFNPLYELGALRVSVTANQNHRAPAVDAGSPRGGFRVTPRR